MRYREGGSLDTGEVQDRRGGGRALAVGGGGVGLVGIIVVVLFSLLGGQGGGGGGTSAAVGSILDQLGSGESADSSELTSDCRTGADANDKRECAIVADIESIQDYWSGALGSTYTRVDTVFFSGSTSTGCGTASSGTGPFYCPADKLVYIDLAFFDELKSRFGAQGGAFADAYVLAHEYGHHVQDVTGTMNRVQPGSSGAASGSVRLELQADCYAGVWANHASTVPDDSGQPLIQDITQDDIDRALDTASRIGDDAIERNLGSGNVDPNSFTHGTSAQREKWLTTGLTSGDPNACDTFQTDDLG